MRQGKIINNLKNITIGSNFMMSPNCQLFAQGRIGDATINIGNNVSINYNVMINADCGGEIIIGNDVLIGPYTVVRAANHIHDNHEILIRNQGHQGGKITIEDDVWIGANVSIVPNVRIGKSTVIGAGSVVCTDIPPFSVAVGNPAKKIRDRRKK